MAAGDSLRVPGYANSQRVAEALDGIGAVDAAVIAAAVLAAVPTAVSTWTPTITASGSMTIAGPTVIEATYSTGNSPYVFFTLHVTFTTGGIASNTVYLTLPTAAVTQDSSFAAPATLDPITSLSYFQIIAGPKLAVFYGSLANLTLAAGHRISICGKYRKV